MQRHYVPVCRVGLDPNDDFPRACELDRVSDEIGEYLPEPSGVSPETQRNPWGHPVGHLQALLLGADRQGPQCSVQDALEVEVLVHQGEFSGLDFREVQNFVDHFQQAIRRVADHTDILVLLRC